MTAPADAARARGRDAAMILDLATLRRLAVELDLALRARRVAGAEAEPGGLRLALPDTPVALLHLGYGPPGDLALGREADLSDGDGPERYLVGATVESVATAPWDRVLTLRLSRRDADGRLTYGQLHLELVPPRYRVVLVGERHGRVLGAWGGAADRGLPARGDTYEPPLAPTGRRAPAGGAGPAAIAALRAADAPLDDALRRTWLGVDRHLAAWLCTAAGLAPDGAPVDLCENDAGRLWSLAEGLFASPPSTACGWLAAPGQYRVSVVPPSGSAAGLRHFDSVCAALRARGDADARDGGGDGGQPARLCRALAVLERRAAALRADLDEVRQAEVLERTGHSLLAALDSLPPGTRAARVADVHDADGKGHLDIELAAGQTPADAAARSLKRAAHLRRRLEVLPARLHRVREHALATQSLLDRLRDGGEGYRIPEEDMERWQRRVDVREPPEQGGAGGRAARTRPTAHPRRYRTSTGWSVWAGRNNRENDALTHGLAAQNDLWFHAHGYAGSHVLLRREGRKEEPSARTLEEAAGVAAYWSKGRTARKVAVVYTLAKYVSKPRGGPPGLAVLKRERTLMVRPALPAADDGEEEEEEDE